MEKNTIGIVIVVLLIGIAAGYALKGTTAVPIGMHQMGGGSLMGRNIDQHFIVQMIPHHEGAIAMAKVALERSKRPEIRSLASGIIEAQEQEIQDMKEWYQSWFGSAPPEGALGMHMGGMTGDVEVLEAVPAAAFDQEFVRQMIPHHEMAIMMASMLQAATERSEMQGLADQIITSQSREIEMMQSWGEE